MTAVHDDPTSTASDAADLEGADHLINHRDAEIELIPPDSLTARLTGLYTFLPINGAAFVMQVMHPIIGDVVDKFSVFRKDPIGRAIRSADSVLRWTYGGQEAIAEGHRLRKLHQPLQMRNAEGRHISALNPEAYAWVIATAFPTMTTAAPLMLGREFSLEERKELLRDNRRIAKIVQVPMKGYPETLEEFDEYFDDFIENKLVRHPVAVELIEQMRQAPPVPKTVPGPLRPALKKVAATASVPLQNFNYLTTVGVMDPRVREILGLTWTDEEQRHLEKIHARLRFAYRTLPERLTYFPLAYHARRHHDAIQAMKRREKASAAYQYASK